MFDYYRDRVQGTTIDAGTLLSTDYFNLFNEVIMVLGMLPDMPEMLEDVDAWCFVSYAEHFTASGLSFAALAIEAYPYVPENIRNQFEMTVSLMRMTVDNARDALHKAFSAGDMDRFGEVALGASMALQRLVDTGSAIVHGYGMALDQVAVDDLFP